MPTFMPPALLAVAQTILEAAGAPPDLALLVGQSLVESNLVGHDSHGILRLRQYLDLIRLGQLRPAARPSLLAQTQATARIDGARGWGQPAAQMAAQLAIRLAGEYGVGVVTIDRCNHIGRLGEYVETISRSAMIGLAMCNTEAVVAPFGGRQGRVGTNPLAWAMPRGAEQEPLVVDFATSGVAEGKLRVARDKGEQVPLGLLVDHDGHPSSVPADYYAGGALLPFGGHKGYGIGVVIELMAGALSGMGVSAAPDYPGGNGTLIMALNIASFVPLVQFTAQADVLSEKIKATPTAAGFSEVMMPGEPEMRARRERLVTGITLPEPTWQDLQALARDVNVKV